MCVRQTGLDGGWTGKREGSRESGIPRRRKSTCESERARAKERRERKREKEEERRKESERVRERDTADILHAITCVDEDVHACRRDFALAQVVHTASRMRHNSFALLLL